MFEANRRRVQNLTGLEIWFFILGRVPKAKIDAATAKRVAGKAKQE